MTDTVIKSALLSSCGQYRYDLHRAWNPALHPLIFIMLNPSTADATKDDPTIRRCMFFAKRGGFGSIRVMNLFAFRATNPADLAATDDPVGPDNVKYLTQAVDYSREHRVPLVCAWGANLHATKTRHEEDSPGSVANMFLKRWHNSNFRCLGKTKEGFPRHPLYVKGDQPLVDYP